MLQTRAPTQRKPPHPGIPAPTPPRTPDPGLGRPIQSPAIYPEDVISHHRAFIARRRAQRPSEEYRDLTTGEWDEFLAHFELRKVALGVCGRDYGTPCAHEKLASGARSFGLTQV